MKAGEDLTRLWWVGAGKRRDANREGITRWTDPRVTPKALGIEGRTTAPRLQALLDVNRGREGPPVRPARVNAARSEWIEEAPAEFYVDFETVSDLDDDFSNIPRRGGQPLIFMIGCGHLEDGEWRFECFITDRLDEPSEARVIDDWFEHMTAVRDRLAPGVDPRVIHWSPHETVTLETAFDAAVKRHRKTGWRAPPTGSHEAEGGGVAAPELVRLPRQGGAGGAAPSDPGVLLHQRPKALQVVAADTSAGRCGAPTASG